MTQPFTSYNAWIMSNGSNPGHTAMIALRNSTGVLVSVIYFYRTGVPLPTNQILANGQLNIYYQENWYREILHLLQTEKPLFAFVDNISRRACIATSELEPVGEQEGV